MVFSLTLSSANRLLQTSMRSNLPKSCFNKNTQIFKRMMETKAEDQRVCKSCVYLTVTMAGGFLYGLIQYGNDETKPSEILNKKVVNAFRCAALGPTFPIWYPVYLNNK